jgi:hypothetical protein
MFIVDVLAINLKIGNQISLGGSIVGQYCTRRGCRIDRATVGSPPHLLYFEKNLRNFLAKQK